MDDKWYVDAPFVGILFVPLERRVSCLRPAPGIVGVAVGPADVVEATDRVVGCLDHEVEELPLVKHPERASLLARTVVGKQKDHCLVELAESGQGIGEASNLGVGVIEETGESLL